MSRDPYLDAKAEVETNITNVNNLLGSYRRIASASNDSSSLQETAEEVRNTVSVLEADLEDLEECVRVIEGHGDRWGIDPIEVGERRSFVNRVTGEVKRLRDKVHDAVGQPTGRTVEPYRDRHSDLEQGDDAEETERWEREEQQLLMRRQDDTLGVISGTLTSLASQAGLIGQEVHEHSEMLDDLSTRVDSTHSRLSRVSRTMQDFIRRNEDSRSSWCIGILILVLIILFIAVILV